MAHEPIKRELYIVALHQAIPFIGFRIMDNAVLILAGEAVDIELGAWLGISTMCAAALGILPTYVVWQLGQYLQHILKESQVDDYVYQT